MAYQSLYRKYRPQRFSELVGQAHLTTALRNAVRDGRVGHAYLFSGPRGTGKTTTARILAKALNCTALGPDGEPCGECDSCVAIADGTFLDLIEIDAASNRGVDDARRLRERVAMGVGAGAKRKVYILDEVHMLTTDASNTLLKTLEEPPEHVVFVLATTAPEQVLPTIRSRAQHFEFTLIPTEQIGELVTDLLTREGVAFDPEAVAMVARAGAGSARDALSLLDQALAHGPERLDADAVAALFGRTPATARMAILDAIAGEDAASALTVLGELLDAGHEPRRVAEDLLSTARDAFLLAAAGGRVPVDTPPDDQTRLTTLGETLGNAALVRVVETIGQAVVDMRGVDAADPRLVLEVTLVRLSRRDAGPPLQTVIERIERLERQVGGGAREGAVPHVEAPERGERRASDRGKQTVGAVRRARDATAGPATAEPPAAPAPEDATAEPATAEPPAAEPAAAPAPADAAPEEPAGEVPAAPATPVDVDDVVVAWASVLPELPVATRSAVQAAQPLRVEGDDVVVFGVAPGMLGAARERFRREADTVRAALADKLGRRVKFSVVAAADFDVMGGSGQRANAAPDDQTPPPTEPPPDDLDPGDIADAVPAGDAPASVSLLQQHLGATVVDEAHRES